MVLVRVTEVDSAVLLVLEDTVMAAAPSTMALFASAGFMWGGAGGLAGLAYGSTPTPLDLLRFR